MARPGRTYPIGASRPILPVMPKKRASTLCTAPIKEAQPNTGMRDAAITRNIREKLVATPPGMCRNSVMRFAAGETSFLEKSPRSQHKAIKRKALRFKCFGFERSIMILLFNEEGVSVSVHTPVRHGVAAARLKDHEALLFRSESSECCRLIIARISEIMNKNNIK